jgi:hypothetical protein
VNTTKYGKYDADIQMFATVSTPEPDEKYLQFLKWCREHNLNGPKAFVEPFTAEV